MIEELLAKGGLSLDRLLNFRRVAKVESFTIAAGGDPNRQTLYSRQVKELEACFGTSLFRRRGRTVRLTAKGRELYALLCEYFSAFEDFTERCGSAMATYVIGAGDSLIQWRMLPRLKEFEQVLPASDLVFKNMRSADIVEGVERGEIDYGVVRRSAVSSKLVWLGLGTLGFRLFFPLSQSGDREDLEWVGSLHFAGMEGNGVYQKHLEDFAIREGVMLRFRVLCSSFPMMVAAVNALGLSAFLPEIADEVLDSGQFESIKVSGIEDLDRELVLCWNERMARLDEEVGSRASAISEILRLN